MKMSEKEIILAHAKTAIIQYIEAKKDTSAYKGQVAVRATIVHALDNLMTELGIDTTEVEEGALPVKCIEFDHAANDAQKAFN